MLNRCPQDVKDILVRNFGSLEYFYAYVYRIGVNQREGFKRTQTIDPTEEYRIKDYLEKVGIDPFVADDLVREIICDFDQQLANNYAQSLLGPNWKEILADFDKKNWDIDSAEMSTQAIFIKTRITANGFKKRRNTGDDEL